MTDMTYTIEDLERIVTSLYIENKVTKGKYESDQRCINSYVSHTKNLSELNNKNRQDIAMYRRRITSLKACIKAVNEIAKEAVTDPNYWNHEALQKIQSIAEKSLYLLSVGGGDET